MANYNSSYTGAQVDAAIGTVQAGVAHSPVLGLSTNTDHDPVIRLTYTQGGETLTSPVAFDKDDFVIQSNHIKLNISSATGQSF